MRHTNAHCTLTELVGEHIRAHFDSDLVPSLGQFLLARLTPYPYLRFPLFPSSLSLSSFSVDLPRDSNISPGMMIDLIGPCGAAIEESKERERVLLIADDSPAALLPFASSAIARAGAATLILAQPYPLDSSTHESKSIAAISLRSPKNSPLTPTASSSTSLTHHLSRITHHSSRITPTPSSPSHPLRRRRVPCLLHQNESRTQNVLPRQALLQSPISNLQLLITNYYGTRPSPQNRSHPRLTPSSLVAARLASPMNMLRSLTSQNSARSSQTQLH